MLISLLNAFRWTAQAVLGVLLDHIAAPTLKRLSARKPYTKFTQALRSFLKKRGLNVTPGFICGLVQAESSGLEFEESS